MRLKLQKMQIRPRVVSGRETHNYKMIYTFIALSDIIVFITLNCIPNNNKTKVIAFHKKRPST